MVGRLVTAAGVWERWRVAKTPSRWNPDPTERRGKQNSHEITRRETMSKGTDTKKEAKKKPTKTLKEKKAEKKSKKDAKGSLV